MASSQVSVNDLSTAQSETYAMLLSMGFDQSNAFAVSKIFGGDVNGAVNYLTSEQQPTSFYASQSVQQTSFTQLKPSKPCNPKPQYQNKYMSPDDIAIQSIFNRISSEIQNELDQQTAILTVAQSQNDNDNDTQEYIPRSQKELEYDEKTNDQIMKITHQSNLSKDQKEAQVTRHTHFACTVYNDSCT